MAERSITVVALDAMGGDHAPVATVQGALAACGADLRVLLVGDEAVISRELEGGAPDVVRHVEIVHASEKISSSEDGARAVRAKPDSSVALACRLVREGRAHAAVSLGHTGAMMAASTLYMRRVPGVIRPGIAVVLPSREGPVVMIDAGATADPRPEHYPQLAAMGRLFSQHVIGVVQPRVGLLSIGEEAERGSEMVIAAHALLRGTPGFVGNVEGRDIPRGTVDVVVTDGFTGNVALKLYEGAGAFMMAEIRDAVKSSVRGRIGGLLVRPSLRRMRERMDPDTYGGAHLLGVQGMSVIGHGSSGSTAVANAIRAAAKGAREGLVERFAAEIAPPKDSPAP